MNILKHHDNNEKEVKIHSMDNETEQIRLMNEDKQNQRNHERAMINDQFYANNIPGSIAPTQNDIQMKQYITHLCQLSGININNRDLTDIGTTRYFHESINKSGYVKSIIVYGVQQYSSSTKEINICFHDSQPNRIRNKMVGGWSYEIYFTRWHNDILLIRFFMDNNVKKTGDIKFEYLKKTGVGIWGNCEIY